jgi:hypothetical protein
MAMSPHSNTSLKTQNMPWMLMEPSISSHWDSSQDCLTQSCIAMPNLTPWKNGSHPLKQSNRSMPRRQALKYTHQAHFQWVNQRQPPRQQCNGARRHPNDETVPMDVDQPVFTQVRRAYTEADKKCLQEQGRCFNCESKATWHANALPRRSNLSDPIRDRSARISSRSDPVCHLPDPVSTSKRSPMDRPSARKGLGSPINLSNTPHRYVLRRLKK